ncbi:MAG: hypothetical protein K2M45_06935 [Muribaculaceae bacterium]|nr:hypothetical protein [Muribaculaceae bacterium]
MEKFNERPKEYSNLHPLFDAAETALLSEEAAVAYSQSEQRLIDEETAREEYAAEREEIGRMEGRKEAAIAMATELKKLGLPIKDIANVTRLSESVIISL